MIKYFISYKRFSILVFILSSVFISTSFHNNTDEKFSQLFKSFFSSHSNRLNENVLTLFNAVEKKNFNPDSARKALAQCRMEYKTIEGFVIHFLPGDARVLNRPIISEMEEDDEISAPVVPHGFQYLEKMLYSDSCRFFQRKIKDEVDEIYVIAGRFNESISYMDFNVRDVFEAMQMQLIRQFMLGFANFETGKSRTAVQESSMVLKSFSEFLQLAYTDAEGERKDIFNRLYQAFNLAIDFLNNVKPGNEPDYFTFYSAYYIPVSQALTRIRESETTGNTYNTTAVNFQVPSIFDPNAFNSFYFLPGKILTSKEDVVELGRSLFFDPALSANNLRACASCHQPGKAFTDGLALSQSFEPGKMLTRNAPTIINAVFQRKLFHDGRAFTFEDQAGQVMSNPLEMHNDFSQVAVKLRASPGYVSWFKKAFAGYEDTIISSRSVLTALAEYERSLVGMNSRFDKTISGRDMLMNDDEKDGFNLFMGKGNCASCHFIPLFNGVMLPEYVETEWEILGVPSSKNNGRRELDPDIGRAGVIQTDIFRHAFKTPTLRNVELTAPYMHNGVFKTLEEVIEFYNIGGGANLGYSVPNQTLSSDSLHLTPTEKFQMVSFLKSLTDTVNLTSRPSSLPVFPNQPELNGRPIGGEY